MDESHQDRIAELIRTARLRLTREDLGLTIRSGPWSHTVSQKEIAEAVGCSDRQLRRLENGELTRVDPSLVDELTRVLRLTGAEADVLRVLTSPRVLQNYVRSSSEALERVAVSVEPAPAYVADASYRLLFANGAVSAWFDDRLPKDNILAWLLVDPHARHVYVEWEQDAEVIVAQLRAAAARHPDDEALADLVEYVRAESPEARRWWDGDGIYVPSDGEWRTLRAPGHTDPARDDPRHHVRARLVILTPPRLEDQRQVGIWQLPPRWRRKLDVQSRDACTACQRDAG